MSDKIVYSTESGDLRSKDADKKKKQTHKKNSPSHKKDGIVRVQRESKGRGGKTVSVVYGLPLSGMELSMCASQLKQKCGTGGTIKDGTIVIQGDKIDAIISYLKEKGYNAKRAGG